jgi:hypothetical protein
MSGGSQNAVRVCRFVLRVEEEHTPLRSVERLQRSESMFAVTWVPATPYRLLECGAV